MQIRYTSKAKKAIDQASKMSKSLHHHYIGTEHILIAMMKETECVASRLLNTLAVNIQKMYVDILIAMGEAASLY